VEQALENPPAVCRGGVVTNTRFSADAIRYGSCVGLALLSWDYPAGKGIKDLVDSLSLYPVTCLTTLTKTEKASLLAAGIVLCRQLHAGGQLLVKSGIPASCASAVLEEVEQLCRL
jgi:hypothetical protein